VSVFYIGVKLGIPRWVGYPGCDCVYLSKLGWVDLVLPPKSYM
ncbi:1421_t:CDS:2, partial [Ambispora leptoticha]